MITINIIRNYLKPWWAKVIAVFVLAILLLGLYATWIYTGYQAEQYVLKTIHNNVRHPYQSTINQYSKYLIPNDTINLLPEFLTKRFPKIEHFGERIAAASILPVPNSKTALLKDLKYLTTIRTQFSDRPHETQVLIDMLKMTPHFNHLAIGSQGNYSPEIINAIITNLKIEHLTLSVNKKHYELSLLTELSKSSSIHELTIISSLPYLARITANPDDYAHPTTKHLQALANCTSLKTLSFSMNHFTEADAIALNKIPSLKKVIITLYKTTQSDKDNVAKINCDVDASFGNLP